ncbi:uncharacterized protein LOC110371424 isoform X2 [Helicoverpa armigera]|uniref:uncharacterized protein LOC110371424 isoform X2 n=1 Tax=Helicoverpa armigera TaxID=29058 RepID=UPI003083BA4A
MMITIHGFPAKTKYQDVKILVKQECNINDFILDNLVNDQDGTKKVRIGLTDNSEGYRLMKCLDGYRMAGNFVLKAVPVGKAAATLSQPAPFETQPSYQNQPRSDYSNAPRNDYIRPTNDYSDPGPHGGPHSHAAQVHGGPHGVAGPHSSGQHGVRASHIQSVPHGSGHQGGVDPMGRPSPWATASSNQTQWSSNAPVAAQVPQNTYSYNSTQAVNPGFGHQHQGHPRPEMRAGFNQTRGPDQGYGFPTKSNIPEGPPRQVETRSALRSIETVDTSVTNPPIHSRYPASQPYQDKPDNFQGPTQYNINNPGGQSGSHSGTHSGPSSHQSQYPQAAPMPWESQSQQPKSFSKPSPTPYEKQYDDRKYPQPEREVKIQPFKPDPQDRTYKDYEKRGFSPRRSPHRRVTPERRVSPSLRRISPSGRRISPSGRKFSPSGRRISPSGRRISPSGRRISPSGRRISPSGRRISPSGRRISPSGRRISPSGRRISPSGRRISPSGRRISPSGRRVSPHARKFSPPVKRVSPDRRIPGHPAMHPARRESPPHKRLSPGRRLVSPPRRPSPGRRESPTRMNRYSPERHHSEKIDKYGQEKVKQIRPAYEPTAHASNQAMYSGGYRQEPRDVQYPMQGMRQAEPRANPWQRDREDPAGPMKKQDDDRRDMARMQIGRDRNPEAVVDSKRTLTPQRKSRSPVRRDRSPLRDRYKRNSPSPRSSHSPRRSWALEKRRSPEIRDAPPPPSWPGQNVRDNDYPRTSRPNFPERDQSENTKRAPVWERPFDKDEDPRARRPDNSERRPFADEKIRPAKEIQIPARQPAPHMQGERIVQREPKFTSREDYEAERRDNYRRRESSPDRKPHPQREDYEPPRRAREHEERPHPDEYHRRREPSPRHEVRKEEPMSSNIDKDFEDIYKKALMFRKKAEELRRIGSKRREDFDTEDERSRSHHGEREREDAPRPQRYEDRHRFREEEMHRPRERDDRPRHDDRPDDIQRRQDYRPRDEYKQADHDRDRERVVERPKRVTLSPASKAKREKAVEDICKKIVERHEMLRQLKGEQRNRVLDELQLSIARIVADMFGSNDVSFIEIIIKYQAKYNMKDEEKILQDVMAALPSPFRIIKRDAPEMSEVPAKIAKRSPSPNLKPEPAVRPRLAESRWNMTMMPPELVTLPMLGMQPHMQPSMNPAIVPMMVPAPFMNPYDNLPQTPVFAAPEPPLYPQQMQQQPPEPSSRDEPHKLYLCKDDFDQISVMQADMLKDFLISQMFNQTEVSQGWAPDLTLKGLQSSHRYEILTTDESTRDWIINLDFSQFKPFNVIVYTKEELWYERAAVWLPGHSRSRNIEPLEKLKLQNRRLEGVNISKWKFVKKIVTNKGTRLYVDMPVASARAIEKNKLMLSYELQKVNVFLKAVAVDKDAFDAGLKEPSVVDVGEISAAVQNSPMPSLTYDPSLVKITLKGCKSLTLMQARKIKECLIYHLFRYHQQSGISRTDFLKYGFFPPNCFGVVPQNPESKKWLLSQYLGKVNRQAVVVLGGEDENTRFFKMTVVVPNEHQINPAVVAERLKQSNQGVKGINFNIWKPLKIVPDRKKAKLDLDIDLESLETLSKMQYQLDYVDHENTSHTVYFRSEYSQSRLEDMINKYKAEMEDSYDIANMDLDSDFDGDDVICLD